jgi:hypothetical protein
MPPGVVLRGDSGPNPGYWGNTATVIQCGATFKGQQAIAMTAVNHANTQGPALAHLALDGSLLASGTAAGIGATGPVTEVSLADVSVNGFPGWGVLCSQDAQALGNNYPYEWHASKMFVNNCALGGISVTSMTDSTWRDVYVLACGGVSAGPGWSVVFAANSTFTACRAEWCGTDGWHLTGQWLTSAGSGGVVMTGCSSDRNNHNGILIDCTGNGPVVMAGCQFRRDGSNGGAGGGGYAGIKCSGVNASPVIMSGISVFPGVNDDGTGVNSPQIGMSVTSSSVVSLESGYIQGASSGIVNGGGNSIFWVGPGVITATGTPAAAGGFTQQQTISYEQFNGTVFAGQGVDVNNPGQGLAVAEGSNAKQGITGAMTGGTITVANTSVTASSRIFLTAQNTGGTAGALRVSARSAGVSFTITSSSGSDTSTVAYQIFEPG